MKAIKGIRFFITTFLIYFCLIAFVVTCSFLLFFQGFDLPAEQVRPAALVTFLNVLFITGILVTIDVIRRKIAVERPVQQIDQALQQIADGDFSVRLDPQNSRPEFAGIMNGINHMVVELSGLETLRTDFIANVSHEMKTPLAVMQNYGTLLQAPDLPNHKRIEYAKSVTDGSRRLADLMTNILKLNRLENQQIYPQATDYDLGEQLCECLLRFEHVWETAGVDIETNIAEGVTIRADEELLSLVWNNLLSNAFKFTPQGGTVSVSLTADDRTATVRISDTGCGMSPQVGAHIFEKFYQGDTSHATQGNGLGLALVKRVVDILQAEIGVQSTLGKGSTFTVKIRRQP